MGNLIRYSPIDEAFDDLFRNFWMHPALRLGGLPLPLPETQIRMDVKEDDKAYIVHAEMPGVKKDDIHVTIDGDQVAISAEVKQEKDVKEGEKVLRSERYYGKVSRAFSLGQDVDQSAAEAKYHDGVLELKLPKKATSPSRELAIQ
jgi:HSP20 family protein